MKTLVLRIILFSIFSFSLFAFEFPKEANTVQEFVPKEWKVIAEEKGDLNQDKREDVVLVIEETNPNNLKKNEVLGPEFLNINPRILLVLFQKDGKYILATKNNKGFIESEGEEENPTLMDPFAGVEIKNNTLKIKFSYAQSAGSFEASNLDYIFRYQEKKFVLIGLTSSSYMRNSGVGESISMNFSTKKAKKTVWKNYLDKKADMKKEKWIDMKISRAYLLEEMKEDTINELFVNNDFE